MRLWEISNEFQFFRKIFITLVVLATLSKVFADSQEDENTLKCIVQFLQEKGVSEDFFTSVANKRFKGEVDCDNLINIKLSKAYGKIRDKLNADSYFAKYSGCIVQAIQTDANKVIVLQREAIKLNGLGVAVWNYFSQKEHLDELKQKIENSINRAATEKCVSVY